MVENRRFESCRQAGILISGLFERIGSARLCVFKRKKSIFGEHMVENRRFESCRQAGILISGLFERIGNRRLCHNHRFRAAARLESLSRVSLRDSETPAFAQPPF